MFCIGSLLIAVSPVDPFPKTVAFHVFKQMLETVVTRVGGIVNMEQGMGSEGEFTYANTLKFYN